MIERRIWTTKAGLMAVVLLIRGKHYCGYVGVNSTHPAYNKDYDEEEIYSLDVHGGVTFTGEMTTMGIVVTEPTWFIGFDCSHYGDGEFPTVDKDGMHSYTNPMSLGFEPKSLEFCTEQCESLASQLMEMVKALPAPTEGIDLDKTSKEIFNMTLSEAHKKGLCVKCKETVVVMPEKKFSDKHFYSEAGKAEWGMTGICEICFDEMFKE